jgi:hypothetical protein
MSELPAFDPDRPFHPLVMNFIAQAFAFQELMVRGSLLTVREKIRPAFIVAAEEGAVHQLDADIGTPLDGYDLVAPYGAEFREKLAGRTGKAFPGHLLTYSWPTELVHSHALKCKSKERRVAYDPDVVAMNYVSDFRRMAQALASSACSLLIAAYAVAKPHNDKSPLFEFFRHCRNAGAHGNRFHFLKGEPVRPAQWREYRILVEMEGKPFIQLPENRGFLYFGDPVLLLWDVERAFPQIVHPTEDSDESETA